MLGRFQKKPGFILPRGINLKWSIPWLLIFIRLVQQTLSLFPHLPVWTYVKKVMPMPSKITSGFSALVTPWLFFKSLDFSLSLSGKMSAFTPGIKVRSGFCFVYNRCENPGFFPPEENLLKEVRTALCRADFFIPSSCAWFWIIFGHDPEKFLKLFRILFLSLEWRCEIPRTFHFKNLAVWLTRSYISTIIKLLFLEMVQIKFLRNRFIKK